MDRVRTGEFALGLTLTSGQTFYWGHLEGGEFVFGRPDGEGFWWGVARRRVWRLKQEGEDLVVGKGDVREVRSLFSLDVDLGRLRAKAEELGDGPLLKALKEYRGLRIMRQDPWEMLVSFMLSPQNRVESIARGTYLLAKGLGEDGGGLPLYPTPERLAEAPDGLLRSLPVRYEVQAFRLREVARIIRDNPGFWEEMPQDYYARRRYLTRLPGVGNKIADCVLAYGLGDGRAVPVDTHILKISRKFYGFEVKGKSLTERVYNAIGNFYRERYGDMAALAQLYLYALSRRPNAARG